MNGRADFSAVIANDITEIAPLRRQVGSFLRCVGPDAPVDDVLLILSELCTNAVEATGDAPAAIGVRIDAVPDELTIEVDDPGPGFPSRSASPAARRPRWPIGVAAWRSCGR